MFLCLCVWVKLEQNAPSSIDFLFVFLSLLLIQSGISKFFPFFSLSLFVDALSTNQMKKKQEKTRKKPILMNLNNSQVAHSGVCVYLVWVSQQVCLYMCVCVFFFQRLASLNDDEINYHSQSSSISQVAHTFQQFFFSLSFFLKLSTQTHKVHHSVALLCCWLPNREPFSSSYTHTQAKPQRKKERKGSKKDEKLLEEFESSNKEKEEKE